MFNAMANSMSAAAAAFFAGAVSVCSSVNFILLLLGAILLASILLSLLGLSGIILPLIAALLLLALFYSPVRRLNRT